MGRRSASIRVFGPAIAGVLLLSVALVPLTGCPKAPIPVGAVISESGEADAYGPNIRRGMELALEQVNKKGVLGGYKLEFQFVNDESSPEEAAKLADELATKFNVRAIIGGVSSPVALALARVANEKNVPVLSPSASSPQLTSVAGEYFQRIYPSDLNEAREMARLARTLNVNRVAVVAVANEFGQANANLFVEAYSGPNYEVVLRENYNGSLPPADADALSTRIAEAQPAAIYVAAYMYDVANLLSALHQRQLQIPVLTTSAVTREILDLAGEAADRLVFPQALFEHDTSPKAAEFNKTFQAKYNEEPNVFAAYGYDAVMVLARAIDKTRVASAPEIRDQLRQIHYDGLTGPISFDEHGDVKRSPHIHAVVRGEIVEFTEMDRSMIGFLAP
ncbi:MAG: ABC transporter substrate-binding protein [Acidobacteria bacterium]|nr:ABC transporter substrate-binding protein [Acidobacteriota bacterium]